MPKDEFDFEDPMELSGMVLATDASTTDAMCECFIEEYMRLGYDHHQVFGLFQNPNLIGMRMVLEERGLAFVRQRIGEVFAMWGRRCDWEAQTPPRTPPPEQQIAMEPSKIDPTGAPVPQLKQ